MPKNKFARRRRYLPRILARETVVRAGRVFTLELLAPATRDDLRSDGCTFRRHSANAELR